VTENGYHNVRNKFPDELYIQLQQALGADRVLRDAPMKEYTSFKAGGRADLLISPESREELRKCLQILTSFEMRYYLMGNGSNLLVRDGGYRGAIVRIGNQLSKIQVEGSFLVAEAGALLSSVASAALSHSLSGFEFASGIPGSIGGAVFMNAGAYGGEMKQVVRDLTVVTRDGKEEKVLFPEELEYGYRKSSLMKNGDVVVSVTLALTPGNREDIAAAMKDLAKKRNEKQPVAYPSAGSFFKRPEGHFAGKLIQDAGLMGARVGGASISTLHAGFLINDQGATASEILALMELVRKKVFAQSGVMLEPEVQIIGEEQESDGK